MNLKLNLYVAKAIRTIEQTMTKKTGQAIRLADMGDDVFVSSNKVRDLLDKLYETRTHTKFSKEVLDPKKLAEKSSSEKEGMIDLLAHLQSNSKKMATREKEILSELKKKGLKDIDIEMELEKRVAAENIQADVALEHIDDFNNQEGNLLDQGLMDSDDFFHYMQEINPLDTDLGKKILDKLQHFKLWTPSA